MPATVVGPSFKVSGWTPPGWLTATPAQRLAFWEAVRPMVLKAKDAELKAGLDRYGKAMAPLAASTVKHRKSAMGPADPGAPPLQPAHGLSRTRSLLVAKATLSGVVCWWIVDKHTGASWGEILKHHRAGSTKKHLPKRDVIGLSPASREKVRIRAFEWWSDYLAGGHFDYKVGTAAQVAEAKANGSFSGWRTAAEVDAKLKARGIGYDENGGGLDFTAFWAKHKGGPPPAGATAPKPPSPPTKPTAKPKIVLPSAAAQAAAQATGKVATPAPPKSQPKKKAAAKPKVKAAAPIAPPPTAPSAPASAIPWPSDLSGLIDVKTLGGSTGAKLVEDPATGRRFVLKRGGNPGHLRSEAQADALYRAIGAEVPESRIYEEAGKPVKLAEFVEGESLGALRKSDPVAFEKACRKLQEHFAADALLGNWDVVGMSYDNVLVAKDGRILRIDNGGSLGFRAQGSPKTAQQWNAKTVLELQTMRRELVSRQNHDVFTSLHDSDLRPQLAAVVAKRKEILDAAVDPTLKATLSGRLDVLERWSKPATGFHADGFKPTPAAEFQRFETNQERLDWIDNHYGDGQHSKWWASLSAAEMTAVKEYSGSYYTPTNEWLRGKTKVKPRGVDRRIADLDSALAKIPTPNGVVMYRGIKDATPVYDALGIKGRDDLRVGMDLDDLGFGSASPNIKKAWEGRDLDKQLQLEIRLPAGSSGAYFGKQSTMPHEEEFLLDRGFRFRILDVGPKWLTVEAVKIPPATPVKPKRGRKVP